MADVQRIPLDDFHFSSDQQTGTQPHTLSADAELLVVSLTWWSSFTTPQVTWNGVQMTLAVFEPPPGVNGAATFVLDVSGMTGANDIGWDLGVAPDEGIWFTVATYKEVDLTTPVKSTDSAGGTAVNTISLTGLTGGANGDMMHGFTGAGTIPGDMSVNDQTEIAETGRYRQLHATYAEKLWSGTNDFIQVDRQSGSGWMTALAILIGQKTGIVPKIAQPDHTTTVHSTDEIALSVRWSLDVENTENPHEVDQVPVNKFGSFDVQLDDIETPHSVDSVDVAIAWHAAPDDVETQHSIDEITLTHVYGLQIADTETPHSMDEAIIGKMETLTLEDMETPSQMTECAVTAAPSSGVTLAIDSMATPHTMDVIAVEGVFTLQIGDTENQHSMDEAPVMKALDATVGEIVEAIWQRLVDEGLVDQTRETWQRQGLDGQAPQTYRKSGQTAGEIVVGGIRITLSGTPSETTQQRQ